MTYANQTNTTSRFNWLRILSGLGIVWYLFGFVQFVMGATMNVDSAVAAGTITAEHGAAISATPLLIWAAYGIACAAGVLAALMLFKGSSTASNLFLTSLIAAAIYFGWVNIISGTAAVRPPEEAIIALVVLGITLGFTILAKRLG